MADLALRAPARPRLSATDGREIEPHRVFCVGKNYADHVAEMGGDARDAPPVFFDKPVSAIVASGEAIPYPPMTEDLHFEAELVVVLERGGSDIAADDADDHIWGYACGNDLTRRDLQALSKSGGHPWDMAKGFDRSAVIGPVTPATEVDLSSAAIACTVNGTARQQSSLANMIWPVPEIIATLSRYVTLEAGDVIMTGTPAGVGPLVSGDRCAVSIDGLADCVVTIA